APKDCDFGGTRRARVSSQSWKRAMRDFFAKENLVPADNRAVRSKRLIGEIGRRLEEQGHDADMASSAAEVMLGGLGLTADESGKTQYLLYLGEGEIDNLARYASEHWDQFQKAVDPSLPARDRKKVAGEAIDKITRQDLLQRLDGGKAADLALFGRMLADLPNRNVDGAAQVAHAISTNAVEVEFDFYTAVDDLRPEDTGGADMLGTIEYVSSTLYRYANLDVNLLTSNLQGDRDLVQTTTRAFADAFVRSLPTGKQNSMAAHNPPSLAVAVVRESGRWSLANAFVEAVRPRRQQDLMQLSVQRLGDYWTRIAGMYGDDAIVSTPLLVDRAYAADAAAFGGAAGTIQHWLDTVMEDLYQGVVPA
ncbi:MAG: type I-E CRISPR-associated protein Cas7/Cse4/CasC, partial [Chloroflexota bacterium]|nr:type I-E CRISPR-associated protein Cas7/Cse4/CasC [Chloroflexota bacterium]